MDFSKIVGHLEPIAQFFDASMIEKLDVIAAHTTPCTFKSGDRFPQTGLEENIAGYIIEGVFRVYSTDATGKETTVRLSGAGDFTMYLEDYKSLNPAIDYHWEAATDATVLTWGRKDLEYLAQTIPNWYFLTLKIMQTMLLRIIIERGEMFSDDATKRYLKFAERYPHLVSQVPLRHIANYLGIAPQSLSRIRQQVGKSFD